MPPNRRPRRSPGALPLTSERDLYINLMRQGMSNAAACRIGGVNRKTGHRWRYGRSITIRAGEIRTYPAITRPAPVSARFLSEAERIAIADGLIRGGSIRVIAAELGRGPPTVSREARRNRDTRTEVYHPFRAQRRAAGRRVRPKLGKLVCNAELRAFVQGHLEQRWSPEQISRALPGLFPGRGAPGRWEGDLIMGTSTRSAIGTLVERTTRYLMLLHLPNGHGAEHVRDALVGAVSALPARVRRSLTWDQGVAMGRPDELTHAPNDPVCLCDRASPWQRGTNENTNGLLRQDFPKGTDLPAHTAERLAIVPADLNTRPRKTLGWETPSRRLDRLLSSTA